MKATVYRTQHFTEEQVKHLRESETHQEKEIARYFWNHPNYEIGPSQLHDVLGCSWPLTSTRRALTNLTQDGILEKTDKSRRGKFGRPEGCWRWKKPQRVPVVQSELKF